MPAPNDLKVNFAQLGRRRARLEPVFTEVMGKELTNDVFEGHVTRLAKRMYFNDGRQMRGIRNILAPFHGQVVTQAARHEMLWRLGAGWDLLASGITPASCFETITPNPVWTGLIIEDIRYCPSDKAGKPRYTLMFRIVCGYFAGLSFEDTLPAKWVRYKLAREIGFARFKPLHINELVGCCLLGAIDLTDFFRPKLEEFDTKCAVISRNRALRKKRAGPCPASFEWACHDCHIGHTSCRPGQFVCPRATHRATYVTKLCPRCNEMQEYDPVSNTCLTCQMREQTRQERMARIGS